MDITPIEAHGWKFQLVNRQLVIEGEQGSNVHVELSAEAAFSLLNYLYQYRDDLAAATESNERTELQEQERSMEAE